MRTEKRAIKSDKLIVLFSETETAKQNQKFPFHFFFRFAVEGWGEETRGKCKEIFWSLHTRVRERVRGALSRITTQSERTRQFQATTRSARAKWVRAKVNTSPQKKITCNLCVGNGVICSKQITQGFEGFIGLRAQQRVSEIWRLEIFNVTTLKIWRRNSLRLRQKNRKQFLETE